MYILRNKSQEAIFNSYTEIIKYSWSKCQLTPIDVHWIIKGIPINGWHLV